MTVEIIEPKSRERIRPRFEAFAFPEPMSGCWLWTGGLTRQGYGMFWLGRGCFKPQIKAPRAAWLLYRGPIPDGLHVLHFCDNPPCVNPDHLFLGTHDDNMADRAAKGRSALCGATGEGNRAVTHPETVLRGSQIRQAKLREDDVRRIRQSPLTLMELAEVYGVSIAALSMAKNRKTWRHVD